MTQKDLRSYLSLNIKSQRKLYLLTQEKLAELSGLSAQTINDIEGCRTWVSDKSLIKIAETLHTTPANLLLEQNKTDCPLKEFDEDLETLKNEITLNVSKQIEDVFLRHYK